MNENTPHTASSHNDEEKSQEDVSFVSTNNAQANDDLPSHAELDALQMAINAASGIDENGEESLEQGDVINDSEKIRVLEEEVARCQDQILRGHAEIQNIKMRTEREVSAARMFSIESFASDMLSIADNLGRALQAIDKTGTENLGANTKILLDGIELTQKELMRVFLRHNVNPIAGKGALFDPSIHQAVVQIPSKDVQKGHVADVMQDGWSLGNRTLRAAMVAVSSGKKASDEQAANVLNDNST